MNLKYLLLAVTFLTFSNDSMAAGGFTWLGGIAHDLHLPWALVTFVFVSLVVLFLGLVYRFELKRRKNVLIPERGLSVGNVFESLGDFIYQSAKSILGDKEGQKHLNIFIFMFFFILINNIFGLIPGFLPPTESLSVTLSLGIFSFLFYNYQGIKAQGIKGYLAHFAGPMLALAPLIFVIEIVSHCVRPLSLALRLRGNISSDHLIFGVISDSIPFTKWVIPVGVLGLGLFVSFIQAYVFTTLSLVYVGGAIEHHDDH